MSEIDQALPSGESGVSGAETLRLLSLMAAPTAFARAASRWAAVYVERAGVTLVAGRAPVGSLQDLEAGGFAAGSGPKPDYRLTEAGLELSRRLLVGDVPDDHATRQMALAVRRPAGDSPALLVNEAESPLLWLFRRRGRDGASLIGEAEFAAGDRLRADIDRARMMPRLTADWERPASTGFSGTALSASETVVAAKLRVDRALSAVGPEFSGLLLDVCGFLKPIDRIERERGWPVRSAKVVISLALARLARHYGYANQAEGRARGQLRSWAESGIQSGFSTVRRPEPA